jgi:hypothetical protein
MTLQSIKAWSFKTIFVLLASILTCFSSARAEYECLVYLASERTPEQVKQLQTRQQIYSLLEAKILSVADDIETLQMSLENSNPDLSQEGNRKLFKLTNELNELWEKTVEILTELEDLKPQFEITDNNLIPFFTLIQNKITQAKNNYSSQKDYAARLIVKYSNEQSMTFESIVENPKLTIADFGYELSTDTNEKFKIFFSSGMVKDLFHSEKTVQNRVVSRSLKDAQKGLFGANYEGAGIKRRRSDNELVEIRSLGKDANFRLYGYIYNKNEIHIVNYTTSSNHDSVQLQQRINEGIYHSRENRGHNP